MTATNMTRRNLHIPDRLWTQLQAYAGRLSAAEERPVSTAEAMRRILEAALAGARAAARNGGENA